MLSRFRCSNRTTNNSGPVRASLCSGIKSHSFLSSSLRALASVQETTAWNSSSSSHLQIQHVLSTSIFLFFLLSKVARPLLASLQAKILIFWGIGDDHNSSQQGRPPCLELLVPPAFCVCTEFKTPTR